MCSSVRVGSYMRTFKQGGATKTWDPASTEGDPNDPCLQREHALDHYGDCCGRGNFEKPGHMAICSTGACGRAWLVARTGCACCLMDGCACVRVCERMCHLLLVCWAPFLPVVTNGFCCGPRMSDRATTLPSVVVGCFVWCGAVLSRACRPLNAAPLVLLSLRTCQFATRSRPGGKRR
jgi:hypothetical protein